MMGVKRVIVGRKEQEWKMFVLEQEYKVS